MTPFSRNVFKRAFNVPDISLAWFACSTSTFCRGNAVNHSTNSRLIRSGSTIGVEGFEHKRLRNGLILSVIHDSNVVIGREVEIGGNNTVAKGFMGQDTKIGDFTKTDCLVHIGHCAQIGARCLIPACAMIAGSTIIGDDVWIGPNASISSSLKIGNGAFVTLGSVVVSDVEEICQKVVVLEKGKMIYEGSIDKLIEDNVRPIYRISVSLDKDFRDKNTKYFKFTNGDVDTYELPLELKDEFNKKIVDAGLTLYHLSQDKVSLEEVIYKIR